MKDEPIATIVIQILKASIKRIYIILIITIVLFVLSIIDSFYQRIKIERILEQIDFVEETETYEMNTQDGNNNYIGGDNNGNIKNN